MLFLGLQGRTIFDIEADIDLMQHNSEIVRFRVCDHDKFEGGWCLVIMQLVVARSI